MACLGYYLWNIIFRFSFLAPENQQTTNVVIDEVVKECGDKYTKDEIRGLYSGY